MLAADSGRLPANAGLGELQTPVNFIAVKEDELLWSSILSRCTGCQERGDVELPSHTLLRYKEIAGAQVHIPTGHWGMTLILDKDTGNTEDL